MNSKTIILMVFAIAIQPPINAFSQSIPAATIKKIDSLYTNWNTTNTPGCVIGIVRNDSLIYAKGYGMANLEYDISNTPVTLFNMASVSKQFTAWAIVLLARQGKLHLDDDIHKYLPWFPDLKAKINIRNLLNHTSGIRDQWQLVSISGTKLEDVITQEQIVNILSKQQALNFMPGEQYLYSSSGYTMLSEIVKTVTGKSLRQFSDSAIFKPLGMSNTHIHDDYTEIEKNRSYSYSTMDGQHFSNSILNYSSSGATSLFTNVNDMSKWVMNFYDHKSGDQKDIDTLTKNVMLNNGTKLSYACGIISKTYKGWRQYSHSGTDAGYQTYLTVFPDLKMGFFVFSNLREFDPQSKAYAMADLFIEANPAKNEEVKQAPRDSVAAILKDPSAIRKFLGDYIGADGLPVSFDVMGNKLYYHLFGQAAFLIQEEKNSFSIAAAPEVKFTFSIKETDTLVEVRTPDQLYYLNKYIKGKPQTDEILKTYTGTYYSPELDCKYSMVLKDHDLFLTNSKYNSRLTLLNNNHLMTDYWWMSHLNMLRDPKHNIIGFEVNSYGIMHLRFNKLNSKDQ
jgi:CubicO group peptidase (beta-lactamase class C family)